MKLEPPPTFKIDSKTIDIIVNKEHEGFLQTIDSRYFYWNEIKYRKDLPLKRIEDNWKLIKTNRIFNYKQLEIGNHRFKYYLTPTIQQELHEFDLKLIGGLYKNPITNYDQAEYLKNSLLTEAIASSQIEGAATTTKVALSMLKSGRKPRNESEQMIFNNLRAIRFIEEGIEELLDFKFIIDIHEIMTMNTSASDCCGSFRVDDEQVYVMDHTDGEIAYTAPSGIEVESLMSELCQFINSDDAFLHPIIKASMLHFFIGYIHPFKDGNGRTARALFYWFLLKKGYGLIKNISISKSIQESRIQYDKAYLKTESDENDLTYFLVYSIKSLRVAFESLIRYRDKKKDEREKAGIIAYRLMELGLNKRQADLLGYFYHKNDSVVSLSAYAKKHSVVRQTARRDISELVKLNLLVDGRDGRNVVVRLNSKDAIDAYLAQ